MPDSATVGIGQHEHGPEQPAELRDVISVPAVARMAVLGGVVRVLGGRRCCEWFDLGHAGHIYTP